MMKIRVEKNKRGKYYWKLVARNGRILAHSEDYSSRMKCLETIFEMRRTRVDED